jgi:hypothetical protein
MNRAKWINIIIVEYSDILSDKHDNSENDDIPSDKHDNIEIWLYFKQ